MKGNFILPTLIFNFIKSNKGVRIADIDIYLQENKYFLSFIRINQIVKYLLKKKYLASTPKPVPPKNKKTAFYTAIKKELI